MYACAMYACVCEREGVRVFVRAFVCVRVIHTYPYTQIYLHTKACVQAQPPLVAEQCLGFMVYGLGFRDYGLEFRV